MAKDNGYPSGPKSPHLDSKMGRKPAGYKRGGKVHEDEAEDKKLIKSAIKAEEKRIARKGGGKC